MCDNRGMARARQCPSPPSRALLNRSFLSPRVIPVDSRHRDCRAFQRRTRYNCVWRIPVGRALTKSINLECSVVFLLENRRRARNSRMQLTNRLVPARLRASTRGRGRKKKGGARFWHYVRDDEVGAQKDSAATNVREGGLLMTVARRKWQRPERVRRNRLENFQRN